MPLGSMPPQTDQGHICAGEAMAARPPTRTARSENFPVASWLMPKRLRRHVLAFYDFARMADDIADAADLTPAEKLAQLSALEAGLGNGGPMVAARMRASIAETDIGDTECRALLIAFRRDAENRNCATWDELIAYCRHSANPVGRYLLRLHGQKERTTFPPGDALCTALQILNHLQDCGDDWRALGRIYVPTQWIGPAERFFADDPEGAYLRRPVLNRCLDRVDGLLDAASVLPAMITARRLSAEVNVMIRLARHLSVRLRHGDPVQRRIALRRTDVARAFGSGLHVLLRGARPVKDAVLVAATVRRAKSSFATAMRILPAERRRAIHAVYGFCRAVDNIADRAAPIAEKRAALEEWRAQLDRLFAGEASDPLGRELSWAIERYGLPRTAFDGMLDGMTIDAAPEVRIPDRAALSHYAGCVAGTVGIMSVRIFGCPGAEAEAFAVSLGEALQLTNILRDIEEDAGLGRLYLPADWLVEAGIALDQPIPAIAANPRLADVCSRLATEVAARYAALPDELPPGTARRMRPALIMQRSYQRIFEKMAARGWRPGGARPRLSGGERLAILLSTARP